MKKDDDKEKNEQAEISLSELLQIGAALFGAKEPSGGLNETGRAIKDDSKNDEDKKVIERRDEAKKREQIQILDSLEYPGGKRVH